MWDTLKDADFWKQYAATLGGTVTALAIVKVLSETLLKNWFKRDFKRFEQKLDVLSKRQEIAFGALHTKRAEIIAKLYAMFVDLHDEMASLRTKNRMRKGPPETEADRREADTHKIFVLWYETEEFYKKNDIYFTDTLNAKIYVLIHKFRDAPDHYISGADHPAEAKDAMYKLLDEINALKRDIRAEFQTLLFVEEKQQGDLVNK